MSMGSCLNELAAETILDYFKSWSDTNPYLKVLEIQIKNFETYNNERKETSFCKYYKVSDRSHQKGSNP